MINTLKITMKYTYFVSEFEANPINVTVYMRNKFTSDFPTVELQRINFLRLEEIDENISLYNEIESDITQEEIDNHQPPVDYII